MSDKIKKITIQIVLDGTAEEEKNLMNNVEATKNVLALATQVGLIKKLPPFVELPIGLFALADFRVIRIEPDTQTSQAE